MLKYLPWIAVLGFSTTLTTNVAYADDAYVCDGGRLVYARPETLEKLKQTDPCIQLFYRNNQPIAAAPAPAQLAPAVSPAAPSAPVATAKNKAPAAKPAPLKNERNATAKTAPAVSETAKPAVAKPVESAPGTDFRNVRIINAPAGPEFFHHTR
ncbi:MAG: hypothetical protein ABL901_13195 [Hyphomicrobiaceae bacterium]